VLLFIVLALTALQFGVLERKGVLPLSALSKGPAVGRERTGAAAVKELSAKVAVTPC